MIMVLPTMFRDTQNRYEPNLPFAQSLSPTMFRDNQNPNEPNLPFSQSPRGEKKYQVSIVGNGTFGNKDIASANFIGIQTEMTLSELREMGFDVSDDIGEGTEASNFSFDYESSVRQSINEVEQNFHEDFMGIANREVIVTESWIKVDRDGDGVAELKRLLTSIDGNTEVALLFLNYILKNKKNSAKFKEANQYRTSWYRFHLQPSLSSANAISFQPSLSNAYTVNENFPFRFAKHL